MESCQMEGVVLVWFQDPEESGTFTTWEVFIVALQTRFGSMAYEDPMLTLTKLRQTPVKVNYKMQFEALSIQI